RHSAAPHGPRLGATGPRPHAHAGAWERGASNPDCRLAGGRGAAGRGRQLTPRRWGAQNGGPLGAAGACEGPLCIRDETMADLPRIALILAGGTIDSVGNDRLDLAWYIEAGKRLGDGELVGSVPELQEIAALTETPFRRLPSHALTAKDLLDL